MDTSCAPFEKQLQEPVVKSWSRVPTQITTSASAAIALALSDPVTPIGPSTVSPLIGSAGGEASSSSLDQTLASVQQEVRSEVPTCSTPVKMTKSVAVGQDDLPEKRRKVTRPGKTFKEAFFYKIEWARTFVSGPMDPLNNPYCFYCQISTASEVRRLYASKRHFRQKWRFVHLRKVDPITDVVTHTVRNKKGDLLTSLELEMELPLFDGDELVEIGEKYPFYNDIRKVREAAVTSKSRCQTQLSLIGDFLRTGGNLNQLRSMWLNVGTFMNHQSSFSDVDWSDERLSVSISYYSIYVVFLSFHRHVFIYSFWTIFIGIFVLGYLSSFLHLLRPGLWSARFVSLRYITRQATTKILRLALITNQSALFFPIQYYTFLILHQVIMRYTG